MCVFDPCLCMGWRLLKTFFEGHPTQSDQFYAHTDFVLVVACCVWWWKGRRGVGKGHSYEMKTFGFPLSFLGKLQKGKGYDGPLGRVKEQFYMG